jgi:hypothetical protein
MSESDIALDFDEATATAQQWQELADEVDRRGAVGPALLERLRGALGELYADYVEGEQRRLLARQGAYQRLADEARRMAQRLENTRNAFETQDAESAAALDRLATE